jgi:hypothetical protein
MPLDLDHKSYLIQGWALAQADNAFSSYGVVFARKANGAAVRVQSIQGASFQRKEDAEQHGIELCKFWIDEQNQNYAVRLFLSVSSRAVLFRGRVFFWLDLAYVRITNANKLKRGDTVLTRSTREVFKDRSLT